MEKSSDVPVDSEHIAQREQAEAQLRAAADRLRAILDNAPVGIVIADSEGRMRETNTAMLRILGYSAAELLNLRFTDFTHPEDQPRNLELFQQLRQGGLQSYELEKRLIRKDGKVIWGWIKSSRLDDELTITMVEDNTARREALDQLQATAKRLKAILEHAPMGIIVSASGESVFEESNTAFQRMTGYSEDELRGMSFKKLTHPDDLAHNLDLVDELMQGKLQTYDFEKRYILKDDRTIWVRVIGSRLDDHHKISIIEDITARKRAQAELERLARIVESAEDAIISLSLDGTILSWNKGAEHLFGYTKKEMIGASEDILLPADSHHERETVRQVAATGKGVDHFGAIRITKSGESKPIGLTISTILDEGGKIIGISKIGRDRTGILKAQQLEEQLLQAQKMEAIGTLAGGVAHDFNNLLMVIQGYVDLLLFQLGPNHGIAPQLQQIRKPVEQAAALTRQLLAFSRKQVLAPVVLNLNTVVANIERMLRRLIGEDIELTVALDPALGQVKVDPGQIEQVIMNLAANARDAMPSGGKLKLQTAQAEFDQSSAPKGFPIAPGRYVLLIVSDSGSGMNEDTQARIFEPFFTTKQKGAGLGLAMVYGIIKQSGGWIWVNSEPGRGTAFTICLPLVPQKPDRTKSPEISGELLAGKGTLLLVEDSDPLREIVRSYLQGGGYSVLDAANGQQALAAAAKHDGAIDLLLTDVVMPGMSGQAVAEKLRTSRPGVRVVYMSGYTDDAIVHHGVLQPGMTLLAKPFTREQLLQKVREALAIG